ncbi:MAG: CCA tRNA nucleotidyltransferase [Bdellovibrionota bacterium]
MNQTPRLHDDWLDPDAVEIVRLLQNKGFTAYLVGGCVRDLLLHHNPKDYDIVTNARPQEIRRIIPFCFIIGKRFRLVLAKRGDRQYEISTFRQDAAPPEPPSENTVEGGTTEGYTESDSEGGSSGGAETSEPAPNPSAPAAEMITSDNIFGTPEEDAFRRDFTINAMFYDPISKKLIDYANAKKDLHDGLVRMIGDPNIRLIEDPIRILRAIRLSQMIRFTLETELRRAMKAHASYLAKTALPRRREEFLKFLRLKDPAEPFVLAHDLDVLKFVSPSLDRILSDHDKAEVFLKHLHDMKLKDKASPLELFGAIAHAFLRTEIQPDPHVEMRTHDLLDNKKFVSWMRDEMGIFKSEQAMIARAMNLSSLLRRRKEFERRGDSRKRAVINNAAFDIALQMAKSDLTLSPSDLQFWHETYERLKVAAPVGHSGGGGSRVHRRPRRQNHRRSRGPASH